MNLKGLGWKSRKEICLMAEMREAHAVSAKDLLTIVSSLTIVNHIFCTHKTAHSPQACKLTNLDYNSDPTFISCQSHNHCTYQEWDIREFLAVFISSSQNYVIPFRWHVLTCWKSFLPITEKSIWRIPTVCVPQVIKFTAGTWSQLFCQCQLSGQKTWIHQIYYPWCQSTASPLLP